MKKAIPVVIVLSLFFCCEQKQQGVERYMEDGVEVIVNHLEPYKIKGEHFRLTLEEEVKINFGNKEFADLGLRVPEFVDSDSEGNIYIVDNYRRSEYFISKFDKDGRFIKNLGHKGQGPGEIQRIYDFEIYNHDRIMISDLRNKKIIEFDKEGTLIKESRYPPLWQEVIPLENGKYLVSLVSGDPSGEDLGMNLCLFKSNFDEIKKIDFYDYFKTKKLKDRTQTRRSFYWRVANSKIYIGNEQRGYEILVYDLDGNLLKKVKKEYEPAKYPEEFRKEMEERAQSDPNLHSLKYTPPFNSFFIDDDGRLFVMTYEQDVDKEGYIHDVFNSEGLFIGRKSIDKYSKLGRFLNQLRATSKNNRFYHLRYKEDGNLELVVYKMRWE